MPNPSSSVDLVAWARINDHTEIQFDVCLGRKVELTIGGPEGLMLDTTERGLLNLLCAISGALNELERAYGPASAA